MKLKYVLDYINQFNRLKQFKQTTNIRHYSLKLSKSLKHERMYTPPPLITTAKRLKREREETYIPSTYTMYIEHVQDF